MGYPIINPPEHPGILFEVEKMDVPCNQSFGLPKDPNIHPLFGVVMKGQRTGLTEYEYSYGKGQDSYQMPITRLPTCSFGTLGTYSDQYNDCYKVPRLPVQSNGQYLDRLYDPTPLPVLDKHFRRNYYRITDPIGVITKEEVTKCRETALGSEIIRPNDEIDSAFTPNYRYKAWVEQPRFTVMTQASTPSPVCPLPAADTRYYDLYHQVRMHRPSPEIKGTQFSSCRVIPIPKDWNNTPIMPPVVADPHFGKFNNHELSGYPD